MSAATPRILGIALCILFTAALLGAADRAPAAGPVQGTVPSVEPPEPEIVLPPVILEVEDLSVERVEARLPPEEDLLPPAREAPLVDVGDIVVADPSVSAAQGAAGSGEAAGQAGGILSAAIELSAGSSGSVAAKISLKSLEGVPRFALDFSHAGLDAARALLDAPGFSTRAEDLAGTLTLSGKAVEAQFAGSFSEEASGLDLEPVPAAPPFLQRLQRSLAGKAGITGRPAEWLTLGAGLDASADSFSLEGSGLPVLAESRLAPSVNAEARYGFARFGLTALYSFSWGSFVPAGLHRLRAGAFFRAELPSGLELSADAAWFGSSAGLSLVPFELRVTAVPSPVLTVSAGGGYRVEPRGLRDAFALDPVVMPSAPGDDRGWFADALVRLALTRDISVSGTALFEAPAAALDTRAGDPPDGFGMLPLVQRQGVRLASDLGLRWGITQAVSFSASYAHQWLPLLDLRPVDSLRGELSALDPSGRWGGTLAAAFDVLSPAAGGAQVPVLSLSGFFAASPVVNLALTASDLLGPLLPQGVRRGLGGYEEPGFRIAAGLRMRL